MLPKSPKNHAPGGKKMAPKTWRPTEDTWAYLTSLKATTEQDHTATIVRALRIMKTLAETMGDDWFEVERRAKVSGRSEGFVIGQLALAQLKAERAAAGKK